MDLTESNNQNSILTLQQVALKLSVSIDVLLQWNDFNILKPTITKSGEIVYSQEQIDKFLEIQKLFQKETPPAPEVNSVVTAPTIADVKTKSAVSKPTAVNNKLFPLGLALFFSALIIPIIAGLILQHGNLKLLFQHSPLTEDTPLSGQSASINHNTDLVAPETKADSSLQKKFTGVNFTAKPDNQPQILGAKSDKNTGINPQANAKVGSIGYSEIANFSANADRSHNLFDASGNIKGETTNTDALGTALGISRLIQSDNGIKPTTNSNLILTFVALSSIFIFFILRKQLAYSLDTDGTDVTIPTHVADHANSRKVLQVDQKMDGTVVLYVQEKEYKLCKPELDSESDQFIEKLMNLSTPDIKEIDYDKSNDEDIRLTTPLSKLVTRLGFVGTKRNLFFPRTSKNKVLFRRYLTEQDLSSMNLHLNEIVKEFS